MLVTQIAAGSIAASELAQFILAEGWSEADQDELAEDITADPRLYYPEYVKMCEIICITPITRGEWRLAAGGG